MSRPDPDREARALRDRQQELVVRDFVELVNEGRIADAAAYLDPDVEYRASSATTVRGRENVVTMLRDLGQAFDNVRTSIVRIGVAESTVLTEQSLEVTLPGMGTATLMGFASFGFAGDRIRAWHQVQS